MLPSTAILRCTGTLAGAITMFFCVSPVHADSEYFHHVFFDNSLNPDYYFYSSGKASAPSQLVLLEHKLPVETRTFLTPPNAIRLAWNSQHGGGWVAAIEVETFRNREISFHGDTLSFWCFAPSHIPGKDLPLIRIADTLQSFSAPLQLQKFLGGLPARRWVQVKIPLRSFVAASLRTLEPNHLRSLIFSQAATDAADHILIVDQVTIDSSDTLNRSNSLPAPEDVRAVGFERHIDISW